MPTLTLTCNPCDHAEWLSCLRQSERQTVVIQAGAARFVVHRRKVLSSSGSPDLDVWPVENESWWRQRAVREAGEWKEPERTLDDRLLESRCMTEELRNDLYNDGTFVMVPGRRERSREREDSRYD